jgi:hypothetical protein
MSVNLPNVINNVTSSQLTSTGQLPASLFDQNFSALANPVNPITPVTGNLTLTAANSGNIYLLNSPSANATITLPAPTNGVTFTFVGNNTSSYTYTLTSPSGNVYLGGTTASNVTINGAVYSVIHLYSDGNNWFVLDPITMNKLTAMGYVTLSQLTNGSISPTFGTTVVANATASNQAVNLGQLTNGSLSPTFGATVVANATATNQAVTLSQILVSNRKVVFTSNGNWTVPANVSTILVSGTGGGSGATQSALGLAGKAAILTSISVTAGHSLAITIGAGGAGGSSSATSGGATTIVDSTTSTTLLSLSGGAIGVGNGTISYAGDGQSSPFGSGGQGAHGNSSTAGQNAVGYGAGGGQGNNATGGNGAPGIIIIEW